MPIQQYTTSASNAKRMTRAMTARKRRRRRSRRNQENLPRTKLSQHPHPPRPKLHQQHHQAPPSPQCQQQQLHQPQRRPRRTKGTSPPQPLNKSLHLSLHHKVRPKQRRKRRHGMTRQKRKIIKQEKPRRTSCLLKLSAQWLPCPQVPYRAQFAWNPATLARATCCTSHSHVQLQKKNQSRAGASPLLPPLLPQLDTCLPNSPRSHLPSTLHYNTQHMFCLSSTTTLYSICLCLPATPCLREGSNKLLFALPFLLQPSSFAQPFSSICQSADPEEAH